MPNNTKKCRTTWLK